MRLFIGIDLPELVVQELVQVQHKLKQQKLFLTRILNSIIYI